jgi:hypothetical protein
MCHFFILLVTVLLHFCNSFSSLSSWFLLSVFIFLVPLLLYCFILQILQVGYGISSLHSFNDSPFSPSRECSLVTHNFCLPFCPFFCCCFLFHTVKFNIPWSFRFFPLISHPPPLFYLILFFPVPRRRMEGYVLIFHTCFFLLLISSSSWLFVFLVP